MSPLLSLLLSLVLSDSPRRTGGLTSRRSLRREARRCFAPSRLHVEVLEDRTVPTAVAPPSGLVSWWTADNTASDLMTRNNATLSNGVAYDTGEVQQAFSFDGVDDRADVGDSASLRLTASLSIEGWILLRAYPTTANTNILWRGDDRGGLDPYKLNIHTDGRLYFMVTDASNTTQVVNAPVPVGQLVHVAATLDDATGAMKLYENGTVVAQIVTGIRPFRDLDPNLHPGLFIGNANSSMNAFNGLIDELSLYNRALTAAEIQGIYNAGSDGKIRMVVAKTNPDLGAIVSAPPTSYVVDFSYAYDPATVQAGDFKVNGIAASAVTLTDADTATFTFASSPVTAEGVQTMHMDTGAVTRLSDGLPLAVYDGSFTYDHTTKFYVIVDGATDGAVKYTNSGDSLGSYNFSAADTHPRGAAANAAGTRIWVADSNKTVYVYNPSGILLGSWTAGGMPGSLLIEGIATNGTDIWLLERSKSKVYKFTGAATRTSGSQNADSSFSLNSGNTEGMGIVTDGTSFWLVDQNTTDKVFKYNLSGSLLGSWTIDPANKVPTGITINPNNPSDIWILDYNNASVYRYAAAAGRTSGSLYATSSFYLGSIGAAMDIADPPGEDMLLRTAALPTSVNPPSAAAFSVVSAGGVAAAPSLALRDAAFALMARESLPGTPALGFPAGGALAPRPDSPAPAVPAAGQRPLDAATLLSPWAGEGLRPERSDLLDGPLADGISPAAALAMDGTAAWTADDAATAP